MTEEDLQCENGFLKFSAYNYHFIGKDDFHGEALYPLKDIPSVNQVLSEGTQIHLTLTKPCISEDDPECKELFRILESRKGDKEAVRFVTKEKENMEP